MRNDFYAKRKIIMTENFNLLKATDAETIEQARYYNKTLEKLSASLRNNKNITDNEMKEMYKNIKSMAINEYNSYQKVKFQKIIFELSKIKREYVFALQEAVSKGFSDRINGNLSHTNLFDTALPFKDYLICNI